MWHIHIREHNLVIKRNKAWIHTTTWMSLENMLSERSHLQKTTYNMISLILNVQNRQMCRDRKQSSNYLTSRQRKEMRSNCQWVWGFFGGDKGVLNLDYSESCIILCTY